MKEYLEDYLDVYFLHSRIKEIDANYTLKLNKKSNQLEIHNEFQRGNSFVMVAQPLNASLLVKLRRTRGERAKKFMLELDEENNKREENNKKALLNKVNDINEEIANYSFKLNQDLTEKDIKKIIKLGGDNA